MKVLPSTAMRSNGADFVRTYHHVEVAPDVTMDDILRPAFWAHHVNGIRVNDLIDVIASDGSLDCQLRVTGKGVGFVQMRARFVWEREGRIADVAKDGDKGSEEDLPLAPDGYVINFAPKTKWRVFTTEPYAEVSRDHASKRAAIEAAAVHFATANKPVAA